MAEVINLFQLHYLETRYACKSKSGILYRKDSMELEFYLEGFTKDNDDGINRQKYHKAIYQAAQDKNPFHIKSDLFPIGIKSHAIRLSHTPNQFDNHAISVEIRLNAKDQFVKLGHAPKELGTILLTYKDKISDAKVYKVRANFHGKFYTSKIILRFDGHKYTTGQVASSIRLRRFSNLLDEIEPTKSIDEPIWVNK